MCRCPVWRGVWRSLPRSPPEPGERCIISRPGEVLRDQKAPATDTSGEPTNPLTPGLRAPCSHSHPHPTVVSSPSNPNWMGYPSYTRVFSCSLALLFRALLRCRSAHSLLTSPAHSRAHFLVPGIFFWVSGFSCAPLSFFYSHPCAFLPSLPLLSSPGFSLSNISGPLQIFFRVAPLFSSAWWGRFFHPVGVSAVSVRKILWVRVSFW